MSSLIFIVGFLSAIVGGKVILDRWKGATLDFPGLLPADPTDPRRVFEHDGVQCWLHPLPDGVELALPGVPNNLTQNLLGVWSPSEGEYTWTGADPAPLLAHASATRVLAGAARSTSIVRLTLSPDGTLRLRLLRPKRKQLAGICEAFTQLSTELELDPHVEEHALEAVNAPSGASVGFPTG